MTHLQQEYFQWMYDLVCEDDRYINLLSRLNSIEFVCTLDRDANRVTNAIDFRYRFGYENGCSDSTIEQLVDISPCSVLEVMVTLAFYCEEHILGDPDRGNRTYIWFGDMLNSLGLLGMDNQHYDREYVDSVVEKLINRTYEPDGRGSLFYIPGCWRDMREAEIWYQFSWYVNEKIEEGE